ncbi:hypothetical protein ACJW31_11G122500 [Castanea mollissima]
MGGGKGSNRYSRISSYSSSSSSSSSSSTTTAPPYKTTSSSTSSSTWWSNFCSSALRTKPQVSPSANSVRVVGDGLVRRLGLLDLVLIGVGASIGAGIFVVTGTVARDVGPASIARSLASYVVTILELFPIFKGMPNWIGNGEEFLGGTLSINVLAPILLVLLTLILCRGVGESSALNSFMTVLKIIIVIIVVFVGAFEVDVSNWSPFAPNGVKSILTGATVVFFAYVGFDAVANSAEESKRPQRDLPIGIMGSLLICIALYIGVCLVITGMVPYKFLGEDAPLAEAFTSKGLKYVSVLISIGAVAGLTTTLLVGLYVQSRLYLGLGRDGLLPALFAKVHPKRHTPIHSQVWVGIVASVLAGLFNVHVLSHILSVGTLTGYSVVSACVITLRWNDKTASQVLSSSWLEGVICLITVACCGFGAGLLYRVSASFIFLIVAVVVASIASLALNSYQDYADPPGFSCPWVPTLPALCIFLNMFLFAQLHYEGWVRFVILSIITIGVYAFYGQYHADPRTEETFVYQRAPLEPIEEA